MKIVRFIGWTKHTVGEIADHLRMSINGASYHVHKLHREGFVRLERSGKNTIVSTPLTIRSSRLFQQIMKAKEEE